MAGVASKFYEIAALTLSVMQMLWYTEQFELYREKLKELGGQFRDWANQDAATYLALRGRDGEFYREHDRILAGRYRICNQRPLRSKGEAFYRMGDALREVKASNRGFTPLRMISANARVGNVAVRMSGIKRASSLILEQRYEDDSHLVGWNAIVAAPVGVDADVVNAYNSVIETSFSMMRQAGRGFNSAGAMFGTALEGLIYGR